MSRYINYGGRQAILRDNGTIVDALTGAALGFATDALLGSGDNADGAILGAIGGALGGPVGGILGGLLGGLLDD